MEIVLIYLYNYIKLFYKYRTCRAILINIKLWAGWRWWNHLNTFERKPAVTNESKNIILLYNFVIFKPINQPLLQTQIYTFYLS